MKREIVKLIIYSLLFVVLTSPIHLELESSIGVWTSTSVILGFFAGILNDIYSQLIKLNKNHK